MGRRSLILGAAGGGLVAALPAPAGAAHAAHPSPHTAVPATGAAGGTTGTAADAATGGRPLPPVLRSRQALLAARQETLATLPLTQHGTTYNLAQKAEWIDSSHFAVGRWDGTMSIFEFETAPYVGPTVTAAVNTPSSQGVQMITVLPRQTLATSNDGSSLLLWRAHESDWSDLRMVAKVDYDPALGVATSGAWLQTEPRTTLVVGHDSGYVTLWSYHPARRALRLLRAVDLRNPVPVNPFGSHVMYGMTTLVGSGANATVVAGSDDGYLSVVRVPSGTVVSQTVFNPSAQRGINSVAARGDKLLAANCSVGAADHNLWYYSVNAATGAVTLLDQLNLIIDTGRIQAFNFDVAWGQYTGGPCWFAGTEEGALWMGTADSQLHLIGYQSLSDGAIGAAIDYTGGPGRLVAVIHNLNQFSTGAA